VLFATEDPKKAPLLWDFSGFTPQYILDMRNGKDLFGMYIAMAAGIRGVAVENIKGMSYVISHDPRIVEIAENYDQTVVALSVHIVQDKVKLPYISPRSITLPCTCYVYPEWCPIHDKHGKVRNPALLPSHGVHRTKMLSLTKAWTPDGTMYSYRRTVLCHLASYLSIFVGLDITSFLSASRLNYESDQVRRRFNVHFGWSLQSESVLGYTIDASQRMLQKPVFPGFYPLFDLFRSGDLVASVLQQVDRKLCIQKAIQDQPATKFDNWNVRYNRSSITSLVDLKPSALEAFPNGIAIKDKGTAHQTLKQGTMKETIEASRPVKGDIDAQLDCFDHTRQAMKKFALNKEVVANGPDDLIHGSAGGSSSSSSIPILSKDTIKESNFVPAPVRQRGRPKFNTEVNQLFPNANLKERSRSARRKISYAELTKLVAEELPQFKNVTGRTFVSRGKPKRNPESSDFTSELHEQKYWALRKVLDAKGLKL
jgi:hypothetical protein